MGLITLVDILVERSIERRIIMYDLTNIEKNKESVHMRGMAFP